MHAWPGAPCGLHTWPASAQAVPRCCARRCARALTTTGHTGNTRHGATSAPRLGGGLVAGLHEHGVGLALVLGHVGVDDPDHIRPARDVRACAAAGCFSAGRRAGRRQDAEPPNSRRPLLYLCHSTTASMLRHAGWPMRCCSADLMGAVNTAGRVVWPAASPFSTEITETRGLAAAIATRWKRAR